MGFWVSTTTYEATTKFFCGFRTLFCGCFRCALRSVPYGGVWVFWIKFLDARFDARKLSSDTLGVTAVNMVIVSLRVRVTATGTHSGE